MSDRKPDSPNETEQHAPLTDSEHGTQPAADSIQRRVGERTPERREEKQLRDSGTIDTNAEENIAPEEVAPKQTSGGPAELDHVPKES